VSIIYQEFNLLPERSVAQNIFVGREPVKGLIIDRRRMEEETAGLLADLGVARSISPRRVVGKLSVAQQQTVEIAKALSFDARILMMDEPTAALSPYEVEALFERVRILQARGLAVLYISHRLEEIMALSGRVTVLKDGQKVGTVATGETSTGKLVSMMVGRELDHYFPPKATPEEVGEAALTVENGGNERLHDINLTLRRGEVVGVAGLEGAGRTELARAIFGADPFTSGRVTLAGRDVAMRSPRTAIRQGIGFLTEDRKSEGLVLIQSIRDNALLGIRALGAQLSGRGENGDKGSSLHSLARSVDLRAAGLYQEVRYLSGGNQQKVVLMKWLATRAKLLIFDEPTRGIDVGAKAGIHELMRELARDGAAILMISSELPEVIGMSDRILAMREGSIAGELPPGSDEASIMTLATGEQDRFDSAGAA